MHPPTLRNEKIRLPRSSSHMFAPQDASLNCRKAEYETCLRLKTVKISPTEINREVMVFSTSNEDTNEVGKSFDTTKQDRS